MDFLMSGLAACGACVFTNPLEVVKTRMQLQGELQAPGTYQRHYRNVFHAFITIGKVDGLAALQKGLAPALLYQFLMNGIRLGTYGLAEAGGYLHTAEGTHSPARSAAAGAMAGVMGAYLGSPIYMGMFQALTEIGQKHGLVGLWRGALGGLPRVIVGSSTQLCTFSSTKDLLSQWEIFPPQSWKLALVAAMMSGIAVVLAMAPFDVACTRLYNQPTDAQGKGLMYRGILDALLQTARTEGIFGMYKGIGASYFRLGPHTILSLFFWDQLRSLYYTDTK
ncbi:solute carrier family 25 member 35 isoform c [Homo sapiens]|uniref:solute carrier family 25 member 35 isoform c n=1 Tax=Homo sapiens TaxID=9606 RepID=UPI000387DEE9|nr:solute carrier family 25 member 35 isoform c [Homo sapiens]|eukprot:NP_001307806.1 solute carrier family 25 member 35 isoform c [Homo sapiens]